MILYTFNSNWTEKVDFRSEHWLQNSDAPSSLFNNRIFLLITQLLVLNLFMFNLVSNFQFRIFFSVRQYTPETAWDQTVESVVKWLSQFNVMPFNFPDDSKINRIKVIHQAESLQKIFNMHFAYLYYVMYTLHVELQFTK